MWVAVAAMRSLLISLLDFVDDQGLSHLNVASDRDKPFRRVSFEVASAPDGGISLPAVIFSARLRAVWLFSLSV